MSKPSTYVEILFEAAKAMTIAGATTKSGVSRKKAERIEDPKGFFKDAKAPYLKEFLDGAAEDGDNRTIIVYNIVWDVEPEEEAQLPKRVSTTLHDVQERPFAVADDDDLMGAIGEWLSNEYTPAISNFEYRFV